MRLTAALGVLAPSLLLADGVIVSGTRVLDEAPALLAYSLDGTLEAEVAIPLPPGISSITPKDTVIDRLGQVHVMVSHAFSNGNLSLCTWTGSAWSHLTIPNWSLGGVTYYGGIGVNDDYVYCPDQDTGNDETAGILRFPIANPAAHQHFPASEFHTVTVGLNGLVYGADRDGNCRIIHPETMVQLADLGFGKLRRGDSVVDLCVAANGDIFTIDLGNDVNHFDPFGNVLAEVQDVGPVGDIEVRADGTLVVGLADKRVLVGTTALDGFTEFPTNPVNDPGAFIRNHLCFADYASTPVPAPPVPVITGLDVAGSGIELRFRRLPGVAYELWQGGSPADLMPLPVNAMGSGTDGSFTLGPGGDIGFLRVSASFTTP